MIENIVFSKLYKNKRYLKKLFEGDKWASQLEALNTSYKELISAISSFSINSFIYTSMPGINTYRIYYFYPNAILNLDTEEYDTEEQIEKDIIDFVKNSVSKDIRLPKSSNTEAYQIKWNHKASRFLMSMPCKIIELNVRNLTYKITDVGFYKNLQNIKFDKQTFIENIKKNLRISQTQLSDLIELITKYKEYRENSIYEKEKIDNDNNFNTSDRLKSFSMEEINPTDSIEPKSNNMINLMTFKDNPNKVRPFIYTKEIVSDDSPRTPNNTCKMLLNNINQLIQKLNNSSNDDRKNCFILTKNNDEEISKIEESLKQFNNNMLFEGEKFKQPKKVNSNKKTKEMLLDKDVLNDAFNTSLRTCDVYKQSFEYASKKIFDQNYVNSEGLNYNTHLYLVELLSPLVVVANKCVWQSLAGSDGFKKLQEITGTSGEDFWNNKSFIGYYTQSNEPLADSYVYINNKKIQISTKGGANGEGAAASIVSLRDYIYEYYGEESQRGRITYFNKNDWDLTPLGERVKKIYPNEFEIFEIISSTPFSELKLNNFKHWLRKDDNVKNMKDVIKVLNNKFNFTDFVMEVLQSASFDFAQVNAIASSTTKDFHFDFTVHYPAVFSGNVKIEAPSKESGFTKFHIYG